MIFLFLIWFRFVKHVLIKADEETSRWAPDLYLKFSKHLYPLNFWILIILWAQSDKKNIQNNSNDS